MIIMCGVFDFAKVERKLSFSGTEAIFVTHFKFEIMNHALRLLTATLLGLVFGFVCFGFASMSPDPLPMAVVLQIIFSRVLIGFAIGISKLRSAWWLHGLLLGLLFSLPLAFSGLMAPDSEEFTKEMMFFSTLLMGGVYGFLIELVTSVILKLRNE